MKIPFFVVWLSSLACAAHAAVIYSQPHNGSGALYQSSVNGTDYDQMTWDSFRLTNSAAITEIRWRGGYLYGGVYSGSVSSWTIAIYGDIANGYQPDIINPPLATYAVAGNAGQTNAGAFGGVAMYDYGFTLPSPFPVSSNQFYWVLIQANQTGIPEWSIAQGSGGNGSCFRRIANVGDWWYYRASGDTAFTLLASDAPMVTIAASASPVGAGAIIGAGDYPVGSTASLKAAPATGYGFSRWTQNGVQVSTATTYNFTAVSNRTLVANFVPAYTVAVGALPAYAGTVAGAGTYNSNATVTVTAADHSGFQFLYWADYGTPVSTLRSYTFSATAGRSLVANYAFLPQTAVFDFDTGWPSVSQGMGMPGSQSNRQVTAYFSTTAGGWSIQSRSSSIIGVNPVFDGNFLYPSTWGSAFQIQFSEPVSDVAFDFTTGELNGDWDVAGTVRLIAYTNSAAAPPVGTGTQQGSWISGAYPEGHLSFHSAVPFDIVRIDEAPIGVPSYLVFADNIVAQRASVTASNVTITTGAFPGYAGATSGDGTYTNGASVTARATPSPGYLFVNWTSAGAVVSSASNYTFLATSNRTLWANFTPLWNISGTAAPAGGGSVAGGGIFPDGASVTLTATASNGYFFVSWTDGGVPVSATAAYSFTATDNRALVANFAAGWTITTSSSPGAGGTTSGGGGYTNGASATVVATPNANYAFVAWKQGSTVVSTNPAYTFTVTTNRALTASFVRTYAITTLASPVAGGALSGQGLYTNGAIATVHAWANPGYLFTNWTDGATVVSTSATYTFTVSSNRTLTANFLSSTPSYTVTASAWPDFAGTVTGGGVYTNGAPVTLTALPDPHYAFAEWTENGLQVSTNASYAFIAAGNRVLVANFTDTNPPPVANGGSFYQLAGQPLAINIADLIWNDYDVDGDPVTLFSVGPTTANRLPLTTNATQILVPTNSTPDSFTYTVTDGNGSKGTGTATIGIITIPMAHAVSFDFGIPGGLWVNFTGVPWYYYTAERATNVTFTGAVQTWPVQAWLDGSIWFWDDFADLGSVPEQAFYRLRFIP